MLTRVLKSVDLYLQNHPGPHYAVFDADGTLWSNDVGENFFHYQIENCNLPALRGINAWDHYIQLKKKHPPTAYLWLAQICSGFTLETVLSWAQAAAHHTPPQVFPQQKKLIEELLQRNINLFVVSASVEWAVTGALEVAGFTQMHAIGVKTKIDGGMISDQQEGEITWREGKAKAFLQVSHNHAPILCCGNTLGDQHLLEMAKACAIAVQSQKADSEHKSLYDDEQGLLRLARQHGWIEMDLSSSTP